MIEPRDRETTDIYPSMRVEQAPPLATTCSKTIVLDGKRYPRRVLQAHGGPKAGPMVARFFDERLPTRFWDKVVPEPMGGCWLWTAACDAQGYGQFKFDGSMRNSHRVAYIALVGEIAAELVTDHLCRVRCCVNPEHLDPVTYAENARRGEGGWQQAARTHCPAGHPYDESNTYRNAGRRHCRECERAKCRRYHAANRESERERSRRYYQTRKNGRAVP